MSFAFTVSFSIRYEKCVGHLTRFTCFFLVNASFAYEHGFISPENMFMDMISDKTNKTQRNLILNNEKRLIRDLFKNYHIKHGRPVANVSDRIVVQLGLNLIQLVKLVNFD